MRKELGFEFGDFTGDHLVQESSDTGVDDTDLFFSSHGDLLLRKN